MKEVRWIYICNRGDLCKHPCDKECFYTHDFFKSKVYRSLIKPATLTFAKTARKDIDEWVQVDPDKSYPLPNMDPKHMHFTSKYSDFETFIFGQTATKMLKPKTSGIEITFKDGSKKKL